MTYAIKKDEQNYLEKVKYDDSVFLFLEGSVWHGRVDSCLGIDPLIKINQKYVIY